VSEAFQALPDLASRALGASVMYANDEFFAPAQNLINPVAAGHDPAAFDIRGKVYDGWETRRRRSPGTDFAIVRLAAPGIIRGVNIDTAFFRGNFPPLGSVEGITLLGYPDVEELVAADWQPLVPLTDLEGNSANMIAVAVPDRVVTHLRLSIRPDGGVARLRAYGEVIADPRLLGSRVDLAALVHGGRVVDCSNMFYASPANVLTPGRAAVMSDGWETARRRDDGNDWLIVALAAPALVHDVVVDTSRFVGNSPGWAQVSDADTGRMLLPRTRLIPDTEHRFRVFSDGEPVSRVRLDIYPDGGISRFRVNGEVAPHARESVAQRWLSLLPAAADRATDEFFD
jgi:allantoicase